MAEVTGNPPVEYRNVGVESAPNPTAGWQAQPETAQPAAGPGGAAGREVAPRSFMWYKIFAIRRALEDLAREPEIHRGFDEAEYFRDSSTASGT